MIHTYAWTPEEPIDATNAFEAFHWRGKRSKLVLKTLPSEPLQGAPDPIENGYRVLCERLRADGYFAGSARHVMFRVLMNFGMWYFGRALVMSERLLSGIVLLAVSYVQSGWIQHECGHCSFTCHPKADRCLQIFFLNVLMGGNARFWNDQHFSHHANTQNAKHDKDLKTLPLVAFHELSLREKGHTILTRNQHLLYWWLINPCVWMIWSFASHPLFAYRRGHLLEYTTTKLASLLFFSYAIFPMMSFTNSVLLFHLTSLIGSCLLLSTFTVSHTITHAYTKNKGWVRPASEHTVNCPNHWLTNWWMGYLNFQIEHHLFPAMPQFRQGVVGKFYVRPFFEKHNLPYDERSFWQANADVFHNLKRVSNAKLG